MQGILLFHYKTLEDYLNKLQQAEVYNLPCEHEKLILEHEERLKEIYINYQEALKQVSIILKEFEEHKQSIRSLMYHHKQCRKQTKKKEINRVA